ncbi:MAG: flagellar biosynthetic protein FliO [Clostridiales bacterium]|nr:flagellar biosynthetic protein FliO [Clostridiales bacterium]
MLKGNKAVLLETNIVDQLNSNKIDEDITQLTSSDNIWEFLGLVLLLVIILIATYYTTKWIGKAKAGQLKSSNFELIDSYRISPNKMLQIVKVADKYIVIAVGKDFTEYITELDESQVKLREGQSNDNISFKKILEKLKDKNDSGAKQID